MAATSLQAAAAQQLTLRLHLKDMPSIGRYIRGIRAVGIREWWHQMQGIGDVKAGRFVGKDQCVSLFEFMLAIRLAFFCLTCLLLFHMWNMKRLWLRMLERMIQHM